MIAKFRVFLFTALILFSSSLFAQTESCNLRISLLTCSPGEELYSTFGHSALRVTDLSTRTDIVYNYGTFDFYDPQFYSKFVRGKLLYYLAQENFTDFRQDYIDENRSIIEQELNLSCEEKLQVQKALFVNLRGDNKFYKYDFLFDNCTTRLRDLIKSKPGTNFKTDSILPAGKTTFRNLIHYYLDKGGMPWSKLGIDMLLGSKIDRASTNEEAMFLPDYLEKGFDSTHESGKNLVASKKTIYEAPPLDNSGGIFTPFFLFTALLLICLIASMFKNSGTRRFFNIADFILFLATGLIGWLIVFMWTATDHIVCRNNFNILWAIPLNLFAAFFIRSDKSWVKSYFKAITIIDILLLVTWFFLPQQLNTALIPLVILLAFRSWRRSRLQN